MFKPYSYTAYILNYQKLMSKFLLLFCFLISVIGSAQEQEFSLTGKTADFEDGTYLYLRDLVNGGDLDSAVVRDNSFRFDTRLPEPTLFVMVYTKDKSNFTEVWLENNPMTFDASEGEFSEAKITGSQDQELFKEMREQVRADILYTDKEVIKQREIDFLKKHPDALVSAYILYGNKRLNQEEVREIFSGLSEEVQKSSLGQRTAKYLETDVPNRGEQYVDISILNSEGKTIKISALKGELTLLQFWSSGCGFSRMMNSTLSKLYTKYHSEGFEVISISNDKNKNAWLQAIEEDSLPWPKNYNLNSRYGKAFKTYGIQGTPSNFLIDSEGIIVAQDLRNEELEKTIKAYLNL